LERSVRILLVTGRLAAEIVKKSASQARGCKEVHVYVADYDVAALLPVDVIIDAVRYAARKGYDVVVLPGLHPAPSSLLRELSTRHGVVIVKGPRDATALPEALEKICREGAEPGEKVDAEPDPARLLERVRPTGVRLPCGLLLPYRPPPIAVWLESYRSPARAACHATIIGAGAGEDWESIKPRLRRLLDAGVCVGIDSPSPDVLVEAANEGASIILSLHPGNIDYVAPRLPKETCVVLIPAEPGSLDAMPPHQRVKILASLAEKAERHGLIPVADPVVEPPLRGLARSIEAYIEASRSLKTPLLAGIGNIYELLDADSLGAVALATSIFAEAGASIMLVSEESWKARGAADEAMIAAAMVSIALSMSTTPKNIGANLLAIKEKKPVTGYRPAEKGVVVDAWRARMQPFRRDPSGDLYIYLEDGLIHVTRIRGGEVVDTVRARSAEEAYRAAIARGMVTLLDHAAYLGRELAYAEQALRLGRSYVQELHGRIKHPREDEGWIIEAYRRLLYGSKTTTSYSSTTGTTTSV